jgi:uncharacterized protein YggE
MATLTVTGYGEVSVPPDEAKVDLSVRTVAATPGQALENVAERARSLVRLLDELGVPPPKRSTSGIWVNDEVEPDAEGRRDGRFQAGERLSVSLPVENVGALLDAAVSRADAYLEGPRFVVAPDNPARNAALHAAGENARARAEAFAAGLGLRVGNVAEASEGGPVYPVVRGFGPMDAGPPIEAGQATVSTTVSVTFEVEPA